MKAEDESGNERKINDMTQVDEYKLPGKNKNALTINDSSYNNSDEYKDEISVSSKQVEASKEPITYNHVCNTSVGIIGVKPASVKVGIIGGGITQGMISRGTIIVKNVVTDVLTDSSKMISGPIRFLSTLLSFRRL